MTTSLSNNDRLGVWVLAFARTKTERVVAACP
jgi:hypothetical protein